MQGRVFDDYPDNLPEEPLLRGTNDPRMKYYAALQKRSGYELKFDPVEAALPPELFVRSTHSIPLYDSFSSEPSTLPVHKSSINIEDPAIETLPPEKTQSSIVTIFSIANTMLGSSLLALPWGFLYTGFAGGIGTVILVGLIAWYTAYLIVKNGMGASDFSEICRDCLGKPGFLSSPLLSYFPPGEWIAIVTSVAVLLGASIAYNILMSDALYDLIEGLMNYTVGKSHSHVSWWSEQTAPLFLILILFPLSNLKSFVVLVKFNTIGIAAVLYLVFYIPTISFVTGKVDFPKTREMDWKFFYLAGILTLAFFIHNCIVSILKTNRYQENNVRDLGLAYLLVGFLYAMIGASAYLAFSTERVIPQDFLRLMSNQNIPTMIARLFVILQLVSVFPLLLIIIRLQFFGAFWHNPYPGWIHVAILNAVIVGITTSITIFYPNIATGFFSYYFFIKNQKVLRFTGAICGLIYVFVLPISTHWVIQKRKGELTWTSIILHSILILAGIASMISQFIPS